MEEHAWEPGSGTLPPGTFLGVPRRRLEVGGFEIGHWFANAAPREEAHGHEHAHLLFVISGAYASSAAGRPSSLGSQLIFHPAQTWHDDRLITGAGSFLSISLVADSVAQDHELPKEAAQVSEISSQMLVRRVLREVGGGADPLVLESLCLQLVANTSIQSRLLPQPERWLDHARAALSDLSRAPSSISALGGQLGVHPVHLTRMFKRRFGCTPGEYQRACRLHRAAELLTADRRRNVADVALDCGFSDQSHLSNAFAQAYGVPPAAYRRMTRRAPG